MPIRVHSGHILDLKKIWVDKEEQEIYIWLDCWICSAYTIMIFLPCAKLAIFERNACFSWLSSVVKYPPICLHCAGNIFVKTVHFAQANKLVDIVTYGFCVLEVYLIGRIGYFLIVTLIERYENKTNHPISSNSHPSATANTHPPTIYCLKWGG